MTWCVAVNKYKCFTMTIKAPYTYDLIFSGLLFSIINEKTNKCMINQKYKWKSYYNQWWMLFCELKWII